MERYEAYKDSGVEWIGEIPEGWGSNRIKDNYRVIAGATPKSDVQEYWNGDIPWITPADYSETQHYVSGGSRSITKMGLESCGTTLVPEGSVIVSNRAPIGLVAIASSDLCTNQGCKAIVPADDGVSSEYLYWYLLTQNEALNSFGRGTTFLELSTQALSAFSYPHPPIVEQRAIADFLDAKTAEIDALVVDFEREVGLLQEYRKAVISEAVTKGLNPEAPMIDSGVEWIGEIPEGWRFGKITSVVDRTHPYAMGDGDHGTIKAESYLETGIPFIRVQNLDWGTELNLDNLVYISETDNEPISNSTLRPGDILFAKTGATIGKTGIVPESMPISNTTSHVGKITVSERHCSRFYLYVLASTVGYTQLWAIASQKTTRPELSIDETKTLIVPIPTSKSEEKAIADYLDTKTAEIDALIEKKQSMADKLREYRKSLISEAVTGKFKVPGVG